MNTGDCKVVVEINAGMTVLAGERGCVGVSCSILLCNGYLELEEICIVHRRKKNSLC